MGKIEPDVHYAIETETSLMFTEHKSQNWKSAHLRLVDSDLHIV